MPNFLCSVPAMVSIATQAGAPPSTVQVSDELRVEWRVQSYSADSQIAKYEQGVKATFGPTVLYCDSLELNFETKIGTARGHTRLVDPEGELLAESLVFNWVAKTGTATDVSITVEGLSFKVAKLSITPTKWVLDRTEATASRTARPDFSVSARQLTIEPGRMGTLKDARFALFGVRLPALPLVSFSLDRRVEGFRLPAISFRRRAGIGTTWSSGFLVNEQTSISAQTAIYPSVLPFTSVAMSWSKVRAAQATSFVRPRNELDDPFGNGYMDNVRVRNPKQEDGSLRESRQSFAVMSTWNQEALARPVTAQNISKPIELVGELGGALGSFGTYGQFRLQRIRPSARANDRNRSVAWVTGSGPVVRILRGLELRSRVDGFATASPSGRYGWARGALSLSVRPAPWARIAAGYARGVERGRPDFAFDGLSVRESWSLRGDIDLGNYRASAITKYSPITKKWYDTEFAVSFVAGSFEPFFRTRLFPREFTIGVNLRATDVLARLTQRNVSRKGTDRKRTAAGPEESLPSSRDLKNP